MANKEYEYCVFCKESIHSSEPRVVKNELCICITCCIDLLEPIYTCDYTGITHLTFKHLLTTSFNRKKRGAIKNYKAILNSLLHKYKFKCVNCESKNNLTIDHIIPVSKGGTDDYSNLQILCKSCNSSKGNKTEDEWISAITKQITKARLKTD